MSSVLRNLNEECANALDQNPAVRSLTEGFSAAPLGDAIVTCRRGKNGKPPTITVHFIKVNPDDESTQHDK